MKIHKGFITAPILITCFTIGSFFAHAEKPIEMVEGKLFESSGLDPAGAPGKNFDLLDWNLSLPVDSNKDGRADTVPSKLLDQGFSAKPLFYTSEDGGMVFIAPNKGAKTSKNTKFTRSELREMLRRDNYAIKAQGVNQNNWVFSSMHRAARKKAGGIDGTLSATLAVNRVTTTGSEKQVGRVIIGQIHAIKDEPIRLYYRKLPQHDKGSIYFAHEINGGDDEWHEMIGSRSHKAAEPEDGIALNEQFSYRIHVENELLTVTIIRENKPNVVKIIDISKSGYHKSNQYMYFKAGVYNQNNTGQDNDYVQATFYFLENKHKGYAH